MQIIYKSYCILIFLNEIFALVIFKTEVVQFSLQVFICKFAMPFINHKFKNINYLCLSFQRKVSPSANSM